MILKHLQNICLHKRQIPQVWAFRIQKIDHVALISKFVQNDPCFSVIVKICLLELSQNSCPYFLHSILFPSPFQKLVYKRINRVIMLTWKNNFLHLKKNIFTLYWKKNIHLPEKNKFSKQKWFLIITRKDNFSNKKFLILNVFYAVHNTNCSEVFFLIFRESFILLTFILPFFSFSSLVRIWFFH